MANVREISSPPPLPDEPPNLDKLPPLGDRASLIRTLTTYGNHYPSYRFTPRSIVSGWLTSDLADEAVAAFQEENPLAGLYAIKALAGYFSGGSFDLSNFSGFSVDKRQSMHKNSKGRTISGWLVTVSW